MLGGEAGQGVFRGLGRRRLRAFARPQKGRDGKQRKCVENPRGRHAGELKRINPCCPFFRSAIWLRSSLKIRSTRHMPKALRFGIWVLVAVAAAVAFGRIALVRGETINAAWLLTAALCSYAIAYRFYSKLIAAKVFALDANRATPAVRLEDGRDYVPTNRWIVFGSHFAAISGPGPLVGPTLAAQFGYLPGVIWIIVGRGARRRGAGLRDPRLVGPAKRQVARPDGARGNRPGGRRDGARRRARHHDRAARRARRSSSSTRSSRARGAWSRSASRFPSRS